MGLSRYPLANLTLLNNCGSRYLVNSKSLLVPGSFTLYINGETIKAGTTSFPISGTGRQLLKGVLYKFKSKNTEDLTLTNVVIKGFYINIILKAALRFKKG